MRCTQPQFSYKFIIVFAASWIILGCGVGLDEVTEGFMLATVTTFELADSSSADSIRVHLAGTIGESSAFSFNRIDTAKTGTLFQIAVWGQYRESSKEAYIPIPPSFDTTVILRATTQGLHYVHVHALGGILRDSTVVY